MKESIRRGFVGYSCRGAAVATSSRVAGGAARARSGPDASADSTTSGAGDGAHRFRHRARQPQRSPPRAARTPFPRASPAPTLRSRDRVRPRLAHALDGSMADGPGRRSVGGWRRRRGLAGPPGTACCAGNTCKAPGRHLRRQRHLRALRRSREQLLHGRSVLGWRVLRQRSLRRVRDDVPDARHDVLQRELRDVRRHGSGVLQRPAVAPGRVSRAPDQHVRRLWRGHAALLQRGHLHRRDARVRRDGRPGLRQPDVPGVRCHAEPCCTNDTCGANLGCAFGMCGMCGGLGGRRAAPGNICTGNNLACGMGLGPGGMQTCELCGIRSGEPCCARQHGAA